MSIDDRPSSASVPVPLPNDGTVSVLPSDRRLVPVPSVLRDPRRTGRLRTLDPSGIKPLAQDFTKTLTRTFKNTDTIDVPQVTRTATAHSPCSTP